MEDEVEFNWEEYLEETGASAAPHTSFKHVSNPPFSASRLGSAHQARRSDEYSAL